MELRQSRYGMGDLRKFDMFRDSRKAQHNSFAHHRAAMLFTFKQPSPVSGGTHSDIRLASGIAGLQARVRAGLLGFAPAATAVSL
jgi:hypothetical protein